MKNGDKIQVVYKECTTCREVKPSGEFYVDKHLKTGLQSACKTCVKKRRAEYVRKNKSKILKSDRERSKIQYKKYTDRYKNRHLRNTYGISLDDYNELFQQQAGCCAICKRHQSEFEKRLYVDHCHKTGKVRGLLCRHCNLGIGHLMDDLTIVKNALDYLEVYY